MVRLVILAILTALPFFGVLHTASSQSTDAPSTELRVAAEGLNEPVYVTGANDGSDRLFVVEKAGTIRIIVDGELLPEPFLDISDRVETSDLERGMLGLAFHPDFRTNGRAFVTHVPTTGAWALEEYSVSDDPNRLDHESAQPLIFLPRENHYGGHYGGMIAFGPDGYLYTSIGDGGGEFDPFSHAQNPATLPGSLLRIDVDGEPPYTVPDDNPFIGVDDLRPEIWSFGLRNPWRFSFDRLTGDLFIGDVGNVKREEVNFAAAGSPAGVNYGWPVLEGSLCSDIAPGCEVTGYELPIHEYDHSIGCTVVGGYVYRYHPASHLYGRYLFGDYCDGTIWSLVPSSEGGWLFETVLDTDLNISSFGEDALGRVYLADVTGGRVYEIVDPAAEQSPAIGGLSQSAIVAGVGVACFLDVYGANFGSGATANLAGTELATERISSQHVRVSIDPATISLSGTAPLEIAIPGAEYPTSNTVEVTIHRSEATGNPVLDTWSRVELPVQSGAAERGWTWGPAPLTCPDLEPYVDAPSQMRVVQYFDKGRLEITDPTGDSDSPWYVTSGLLVKEMVTGQVQTGHTRFDSRPPAQLNVAGDPDGTTGPTYASLGVHLTDDPALIRDVLTQRIDRSGQVADNPELSTYQVAIAVIDSVTNHAIAEPFWEAMNSTGLVWVDDSVTTDRLYANPYYLTGRPITEAYWTSVPVQGQQADVLIQCFERRCLTFTPSQQAGWQVETNNAGLHYDEWRNQSE